MKLLELISEPSGKLSSTRLLLVMLTVAALVAWFLGNPFSIEYLTFTASFGGVRALSRYAEKRPAP